MYFLWKTRNIVAKVYTMLYSAIHPIQKKILFISFSGKQYSDNPRAISEVVHSMYPQFEIVWMLNQSEDRYGIIPSYVRTVSDKRKLALRFYRELATSFCFVTNANLESDIYKRKKQFFVQTWHGDRAFKKVLYDSWENKKRPVPITDNKNTDIAVSGSKFGTNVYHTAFRYNGKILECGSPRNDCLLNSDTEYIRTIKEKLGIKDQKILLYAPTFRDKKQSKQNINVDLERVISVLEKRTDEEWICLIRSHPGACHLDSSQSQGLVDVSDYPDMADLLCIADFLLTDYSSSILDYYLTGKPSVCAAFDEKEYEHSCRGLKVRPINSGVVVARSQQELEDIIMTYSTDDYAEAYKKIDAVYGTKESGNASYTVATAIVEHYKSYFEKD